MLAIKTKRNSAPVTMPKVPLQPLQAHHQRRVSHMIALDGIGAERAGEKEYPSMVRRSGAVNGNASSGDLLVSGSSGGGGVRKVQSTIKSIMPTTRAKSNSASAVSGIVRVASMPGQHTKGKTSTSWNLMGRKGNSNILVDAIG